MAEDRLDRIEAGLDALRLRQEAMQNYIDAQIPVIAELRASNVQLRETAIQFRETTESILQTLVIHQQNFEVVVNEIKKINLDIRRLQTGES